MQIFRNTNIDFLRWQWHALALSTLVIAAGLVMIFARGLPLGIDFSGGTIVVVRFAEPVTEDQVRQALAAIPGEKVVQRYGTAGDEILIRMPELVEEEGAALEHNARLILQSLETADLGEFELLATEIVGPVIGADLQRKGIYATLAALFAITAYIALRFRPGFAVGALAATFHDILVTVSFLVVFGYELSLNVVAAILTITGYSVNDTIVIFDRVRENLRVMRRDALDAVVNRSVNQTLARTVITSGTTTGAVAVLYLFGGEVLRGFAFTMLVGVLAGTYSTIFIAGGIAVLIDRRKAVARRSRVAAAPPAEAVAAEGAKKAGRKARVS